MALMRLKTLLVLGIVIVSPLLSTGAAEKKDATMSDDTSKVVNWNKPSKHDIVERAVSDGVTDPKKIVEFAKDHRVTMTVDEVNEIKKRLKPVKQAL